MRRHQQLRGMSRLGVRDEEDKLSTPQEKDLVG